MRPEDRYDSLIQFYSLREGIDWRLVKRLIAVESAFQPDAVSPKGAVGLAQFMPETWAQWGRGQRDNPEASIDACTRYLRWLYECFDEIPDPNERWRFAVAAYNSGRANINRALSKAREKAGHPASYDEWRSLGSPPGPWQTWQYTSELLPLVTGRHAAETIQYVAKVMPPNERLV